LAFGMPPGSGDGGDQPKEMTMSFDPGKYRPFAAVALPDRAWPGHTITRAPAWCSVDLRDGNQALVEPMGTERKRRFFDTLVRVGFKEIEVGFPAASQTDFDFVRLLVSEKRIPSDVTIQVLTQARPHLIARTFEAIAGTRRAVVHLYNSTSTLQRRVVFRMERDQIKQMAVHGALLVKEAAAKCPETEIVLEYSPESFSATELDFAAEVCDAVADAWGATPQRKLIVNLPATVEMATPNVYADQVEWMSRNLQHRDAMILSVHTHNDRGCAVAAAELALLAGAERVEGTLFGNGERTGNVDVVTLALNLYSQGVPPGLDLSDVPSLVEVFESCNRLPVHPRHPYAGELVFTAFSGSHQDAIRKGLEALVEEKNPYWEVPYLPIDPADLGRKYEPLIRINSQSGKGGLAFVLERAHGYRVPKGLAVDFSHVIQQITDRTGEELTPAAVFEAFEREYLNPTGTFSLGDYSLQHHGPADCTFLAEVTSDGEQFELRGGGNGPIDAFLKALNSRTGKGVKVTDYSEHSLGDGAEAEAVAYVELRDAQGNRAFGVGRDDDIVRASLRAVVSGLNRLGAR
jgi:2-isopropylmalate synthase